MNRKFQKTISLLLTLAMLCGLLFTTAFAAEPDAEVPDDSSEAVVTTVEEGTDETASDDEYAETITGGDVINQAGVYTVTGETQGVITIKTTGQVQLSGGSEDAFLNGISFTNAWTDESGDQQTDTASVLINGLFIASPYQGGAVFDFAEGTDITFQYTGRNVLETQGYNNGAVIRVAKTSASGGSKLTLTGTGTEYYLYLYKHCGSAAIGGNMNEACGKITIGDGNLFIKGSQTGAVIGGDSKTVTNGDITINGGVNSIVAVARGAAIGASNQGECAGNVYINGGSTLINVDFSGSAIGRGDSGTTTGTLYMNGGSLKCVVDANAGGTWGTSTTEDTVSNNAITAQIVYGNSGTRTADVAEVNLSGLELGGALTITATVNGEEKPFSFSKGINRYDYVRSTTTTSANWAVNMNNQSAYIYLPIDSTSGTITAADGSGAVKQYAYTYTSGEFVVTPLATHTVTLSGSHVTYWVNGATTSSVQVQTGDSLTFYVQPDPGYKVDSVAPSTLVSHDGGYYTLTNVTADTTVTATAVEGTAYQVTFAAGNYTAYIDDIPVKTATLNKDSVLIFKPVADAGYKVVDATTTNATCDPLSDGEWKIYQANGAVEVTVTTATTGQVYVNFSGNHAEALVDGVISTRVEAPYGGNLSFTVTPHLGYNVTAVAAGSTELTPVGGVYTVENVTQDVTVQISTNTDDGNYWLKYADTTWYSDAATSFTLNDAADLAGLALLVVDEGKTFQGKTVTLGSDIDLSAHAWVPIGGGGATSDGSPASGTHAFQGAFDGDGHTVSGLRIAPSAFADGFGGFGLFGAVRGGSISDVTVAGSITFTNNVTAVGGVVGYTTGSISNVVNRVAITVNNAGASMTGGVAGVLENKDNSAGISITNSANVANVTGRARLGGIVGAMYATEGNPVSVDQCFNMGTLTGVNSSGRAYVGGIAGYSQGAITNCYNRGAITVGEGRYYVGGIAGILNGASAPYGSITDCYADGSLTCTGTSGLAQVYAIWGANDDSSNVAVTNAVYLSSQTQETMSASCTNLNKLASMATSAAIGEGYLNGTYFAQYGAKDPILKWQGISVSDGAAASLNAALSQISDVRCMVFIDSQPVVLSTGDAVTIADGEWVARGSATGSLITVNGGSLTVTGGRIFDEAANTAITLTSGSLILAPADDAEFEIQGVVYLAANQVISLGAPAADITPVTIQCADAAANRIAVSGIDGYTVIEEDAGGFTYYGGEFTIEYDPIEENLILGQ